MIRFLLLSLLCWMQTGLYSTLKVGMELSYPPFEMIDEQGKPAGISVDLAYAFSKWIGEPIRIENTPFAVLLPALKAGEIDLILSSLTQTAERAESIAFTEPYLVTGLCLLLNIQTTGSTMEELDQKGNRIVVKLGTTGEIYARNHVHRATIVSLDQESACVQEVVQNKAQAFIYDQFSVYAQWQANLTTTKANLTPFQREYWAIGIRKDNTVLRDKVNAFLNAYRRDGGFQKLESKYFGKDLKAFQELGIPSVFCKNSYRAHQ